MGGGDGDGGYQERAATESRAKQQARDKVNAMFGSAPAARGAAMPDRAAFTGSQVAPTHQDGDTWGSAPAPVFDGVGYQKAVDDANAAQALSVDAVKNKAARESLYEKVRGDTFAAGRRQLDEGLSEAGRKNKFQLYAQGLNGSSTEDDQKALLNRTYQKGLLDVGAQADSTKAELFGNDESTRLGLLQSLDAGMDQGSAVSSALNQMKVNSDRAASTQLGTNVGDLFASAGTLYNQNKIYGAEARARRDFRDANPGMTATGSSGTTSRTY